MVGRSEQHARGLSAWRGLVVALGVLGAAAALAAADSAPDYRLELAEQPTRSG